MAALELTNCDALCFSPTCCCYDPTSNAILTYLAEKHKWTDVYPTEVQARAKVNQYLHWHHTNARLSTMNVLRPYFRRERGASTPESLALLENKDATISKFVGILEQFFVAPYIAESKQATLADFACYCELDQLELMEVFDFSKYPKTSDWLARMKVSECVWLVVGVVGECELTVLLTWYLCGDCRRSRTTTRSACR